MQNTLTKKCSIKPIEQVGMPEGQQSSQNKNTETCKKF